MSRHIAGHPRLKPMQWIRFTSDVRLFGVAVDKGMISDLSIEDLVIKNSIGAKVPLYPFKKDTYAKFMGSRGINLYFSINGKDYIGFNDTISYNIVSSKRYDALEALYGK